MSSRTRSGRSSSIAVSAAAPSSASPITANPSASRIMRAQVRKLGWSSTMRTRVRVSMGELWQTSTIWVVWQTALLALASAWARGATPSAPAQLRPRQRAPSGMCPAEGGDQAAGFGFCRILLGEARPAHCEGDCVPCHALLRHTRAHDVDRAAFERADPLGAAALRVGRSVDSAARRDAGRRRARHRRRRPRVPRLRRRHRVPEHRSPVRAGRRGDPAAGRRLPPPVLHGRGLRAVHRHVPAPRRALAVLRRRPEVDPRQLGRGGERERGEDRARRHRPPRRRRVRQRVPRADAPDDDDDEQGAPVQGGLRPVRARGLPCAGAVPLSRDHERRCARRA